MILDKKEKRIIKKMFKQPQWRGIPSLMDEERLGGFNESGDNFSLFGFLPEKFSKYSDAEIRELLNDLMREEIYSPYDCTGKRFSRWINFHRNPCGRISYVHRLGVDV